jgi:HAD superfamily hydrolase (TIGR01490 family)
MVTAALCAVAAAGPPPEPAVYQVASGDVQPLRYSVLTETIQHWFHDHPIYDPTGLPVSAGDFEYTGTSGLEQRLERARKLLDYAGRAANALPVRGRRASIVERVAERRELVDQALGYVQLYGHYGKCEARYGIDHLMELWARLDDADRAQFGFDPTVIDWPHYITEIHLPTVVQQGRLRTTPGARRGPAREARLRAAVLHPDRQFAAFDLENTLIASNVVESYAWLATRRLNPRERLRFAVRTVAQTPGLWMRDRVDRSDFLRFFYRRYEGAPIDQLDADALEMFRQMILTKAFPSGLRRVREHSRAGHRTVLITGALDIVTAPLAPLFDDVIAASMTRRDDGTWSGELVGVPPTGEVRAQVMLAWAAAHGFDPAQGVAYADAASDLPLFEAVGFPVAVNPEPRLITIAEKRGWLTEDWHTSPGSPKPLLPMAPPTPKQLVAR